MERKQAQIALTYLITFFPEDICEDGNKVSKEEFRDTVDDHVNQIMTDIEEATGLIANDIETEILGF